MGHHEGIHPFTLYLTRRTGYGPPFSTPLPLFWLLHGQPRMWDKHHRKGMYKVTHRPPYGLRQGAENWRDFAATVPWFSDLASSGRLFVAPQDWPRPWVPGWPEWVKPVHLLRCFGGRNFAEPRRPPYFRWANFLGMQELVAYFYGVPLDRKALVLAKRAATRLLRTPQFIIWAYNVPTPDIRRLDRDPLRQAVDVAQLAEDPLAASDYQIKQALPPWAWDPKELLPLQQPFDPLRTKTWDLVRYKKDKLLGMEGPHTELLRPPLARPRKMHYKLPKWKWRTPFSFVDVPPR